MPIHSDKKSLAELINEELTRMNLPAEFNRLENFITDGKKSAEFIRFLLEDESYRLPDEQDSLYDTAELRARHSAVTFLMGLVFRRFGGLFEAFPIEENWDEKTAVRIWLITSLYHDKAYSSEYIKRPELEYREKFLPYLLTDDYEGGYSELNGFSIRYPKYLAYTYEEILNYDRYARRYHQEKQSDEKLDHGILGGIMVFSDLAKKAIRRKTVDELPVIKACSLTVAQHNIYKSDEKNRDKLYREYFLERLVSTSDFRITPEQPLLLFLSLIDTVECVKRFSKHENFENYLQTTTVLKSIKLDVQPDRIEIDFSSLRGEIAGKKKDKGLNAEMSLSENFEGYLGNLKNLEKWTAFRAEENEKDKYQFRIELTQDIDFSELADEFLREVCCV